MVIKYHMRRRPLCVEYSIMNTFKLVNSQTSNGQDYDFVLFAGGFYNFLLVCSTKQNSQKKNSLQYIHTFKTSYHNSFNKKKLIAF
ncbi:hypothetical protein MOSE0_K09120 [Monosporozyma servazzii]